MRERERWGGVGGQRREGGAESPLAFTKVLTLFIQQNSVSETTAQEPAWRGDACQACAPWPCPWSEVHTPDAVSLPLEYRHRCSR